MGAWVDGVVDGRVVKWWGMGVRGKRTPHPTKLTAARSVPRGLHPTIILAGHCAA